MTVASQPNRKSRGKKEKERRSALIVLPSAKQRGGGGKKGKEDLSPPIKSSKKQMDKFSSTKLDLARPRAEKRLITIRRTAVSIIGVWGSGTEKRRQENSPTRRQKSLLLKEGVQRP